MADVSTVTHWHPIYMGSVDSPKETSVHNTDMKSKVFVSCGQANDAEREVARNIGKMLEGRGFQVYIAVDVQTIHDINGGIIRELKDSDCYLFVNFRRDKINRKSGGQYRGSLFSNQELAIAYALGFKNLLVINERGLLLEGILRYMGINTETFDGPHDCCAVVQKVLDRSGWRADYSRRLRADDLRFATELIRYDNLVGRFLYVDIQNHRPDIAALEATARLAEFGPTGQALRPSTIRSPLKATAFRGFSHTIFPKSHEAFDLLCVGTYAKQELNFLAPPASGAFITPPVVVHQERDVFLNTALDVDAPPRLPITPGVWRLRYEFFAIDFPVLSVLVELTVLADNEPSAKLISQEVI